MRMVRKVGAIPFVFGRKAAKAIAIAITLVGSLAFCTNAQAQQTWQFQDIGSVGVTGSTIYNSSTNSYTVQGAGTQIGGSSDSFQYAYTTLSGSVEIVAKVASPTATASNAAAGIVVRDSLLANAANASIYLTPSNGVGFSYRSADGGTTSSASNVAATAPVWLRLVVGSTTITGYESTDGNQWVLVGQTTLASPNPFASTFYSGFAVCSGDPTTLGSAVFSNISILNNVPQTGNGLQLWLRSDAGVTVNGSNQISAWADQSGNGNNVAQSTSGAQPILTANVLNGKPVVRFNGSSQFLSGSNANFKPTNVTTVAIYRLGSGARGNPGPLIVQPYTNDGTTGPDKTWALMGETGGQQPSLQCDPGGVLTGYNYSASAPLSTGNLLEATLGSTTSNIYLNGSSPVTASVSGAIQYGGATNFYLGTPGTNTGYYLNGDIAELLVYNRVLTDAERQAIELYAYQKYGVGVQPSTSTVGSSLPTGTYSGTQSVSFNVPAGTTLYYTTDGSTPTTGSTAYTGPISIGSTTTLRWISVQSGYASSPISSATYTIDSTTSAISRSGLGIWFKADSLTTLSNGGTVSAWSDQSGNGNDVTQTTSGNQPTLTTNALGGYPVVHFSGGTHFLQGSNANFKPTALTAIAIYRLASGTRGLPGPLIGQSYVPDASSTPNRTWFLMGETGNSLPALIADPNGVSTNFNASASSALGTGQILEGTLDPTSGKMYLNSGAATTTAAGGTIQYGSAPNFYLGTFGQSAYALNGDIAEVFVYNRVITDAERQAIEIYAYQKYGVGTPPTTATVSPTVGTGTYGSGQSVSFTVPTGATLFYTTNGSTPTTSSTVYTGPITISGTTTLKWITATTGFFNSPVSTATYTIDTTTATIPRSGLGMWFKADSLGALSSGSAVSAWSDQSGNGNDVAQTTSGNQPTLTTSALGGYPVVHFNGGNQFLQGSNANFKPTALTAIAIYRLGSGTRGNPGPLIGQPYVPDGSSNPSRTWFLMGETGGDLPSLIADPNGVSTNFNASASSALGTGQILEGTLDPTTAKLYLNSGAANTTAAGGAIQYGSAPNFYLGTFGQSSYALNGDIAEVFVYNRVLTDAERLAIEIYAYQKYGVGTPPTTASVGASVGTGTYGSGQSVSFTVPTGVTLFYTTDGSTPTTSSTVYTGPISISSTTTLKWITATTGLFNSPVSSATYTIDGSTATIPRSGLGMWFKADSLTGLSSGSAVSAWSDQSGNGNNVAQTTTGNQPTLTTNALGGYPVVHFNGGNQFLQGSNANFKPTAVSAIAIYRLGSGTRGAPGPLIGQPYIPDGSSNPSRTWFLMGETGGDLPAVIADPNGVSATFNASASSALGTGQILEGTLDSTTAKIYLNSGAATTASTGGAIQYGSASNFYLGTFGQSVYSLNGDIAEVFVYNRVLTDAERQAIELYAYQKYGVGAVPISATVGASLATGTYTGTQSVSFTVPTGMTLYYTTDGSAPTTSSTVYTGPISISSTTTLRWFTAQSGLTNSPVSSAIYTIDNSTSVIPRSGLGVWFKADSLTTVANGGSVSAWADQSGNGNDTAQTASGNQPTLIADVLNGKPVVRFNGSNQYLSGNNAAFKPSNLSVIAIYRLGSGARGNANPLISQPYFEDVSIEPEKTWALLGETTGQVPDFQGDAGGVLTFYQGTASAPLNTGQLLETTFDGVTDKLYLNGGAAISNPAGGAIQYGTAANFYLGTFAQSSSLLNGDIAELLVYNRVLTDAERQQVEFYAYQKYGVGVQQIAPALAAGTYGSSQSVSFTVPTGVTLYYTVDGSTPTTSSTVYSGPISIASTATLKWLTVWSGYTSPVSSASYTIDGGTSVIPRSGLGIWFKADSLGSLASGSGVSAWVDQSGSGNNVFQSTSGNQPTLVTNVLNGQPVVRFNGSNQYLQGSNANFKPSNLSLIAIYRLGSGARNNPSPLICQPYGEDASVAPNRTWDLMGETQGPELPAFQADPGGVNYTSFTASSSSPLGTGQLLESTFDGSSAKVYLNGGTPTTTASSGAIQYGGAANFYLGTFGLSSAVLNGDVAEILVYNRVLTDAERQAIELYAYQKYGVGVPPTTGVAPTLTPSVAAGSYSGAQSVAFTVPAGVTLYYTVDGSTPTTSSTVYSGPINVSSTATLQWFTAESGYSNSPVSSAAYSINIAPLLTPSIVAGTYTSGQSVGFTVPTGVILYYTTDGSAPTTSSTVYTGPISIASTTTLQWFAAKSGYGNSAVSSATYTINIAPLLTPSIAAGTYTSGQSVGFTVPAGVTLYYTVDGSTPTASSTVYSGPISIASTATLKWFTAESGYGNSAVSSAAYTINIAPLLTPSIAPGTYTSGQSVSFTVPAGVTLYYTLDGSTPTASSTVYGGPISVGSTATLKWFTVESGYGNSAVGSATYTINIAPLLTPSVAAGSYPAAQSVSFTVPAGVTLYYTVDGTTPTAGSTAYSGPIAINSTATLKWYASESGYGDSAVSSAVYTINIAPLLTPNVAAGSYPGAQSVSFTVPAGVTLYYTLDGSTPTTGSTAYSGPIGIGSTTTLKWFTTESGYGNSAVSSAVYTINTAPVLTPSIAAGTYTSVQSVSFTVPAGVTLYYTIDGGAPTIGSTAYSGPISIASTATLKWLTAESGYGNSTVSSAAYTINIAPVLTPSLAEGTYPGAQSVGFTVPAGVTLYYTIDGSTPTTGSTPYSGPISIASTATLKWFTVESGYGSSAVSSAAYVINIAPVLTPSIAAGSYPGSQNISFTVPAGVALYYTLDGSIPTTGSTVYSGPINIGSTTTLKWFAAESGYGNSAVSSAAYTINIVPILTPSVAAGTYTSGQSVGFTVPAGVTLYYTLDGSTPSAGSTVYSGPISISATATLKWFTAESGYGNSAVSSAAYTINIAPTLLPSVAGGSYPGSQSVSFTVPAGVTLYYTIDGSTPTTGSTAYSGPISIASTATLKWFTAESGYGNSAVSSAAYVINIAPVLTPSIPAGTYPGAQSVSFTVPGGVTLYYTLDGSTPTTGSTAYSGPISIGSTAMLKWFTAESGYGNSAVSSAVYTINTAPVLMPSIAAGSYSSVQSVSFAVPGGVTLYYTLDGSTPSTSSTAYGGPIAISGTATLKWFTVESGYGDSAASSATYVINAATFSILSGNNQVNDAGTLTPIPLAVQVTSASGQAFANGSISFTVTQGGGALAQTNQGTPVDAGTYTLLTDADGKAQIYYRQSSVAGTVGQVTITAGGGVVVLTETSGSPGPDIAGNGLPDQWELANHFDLDVPNALYDADGDGVSNLQEYLNGTNPMKNTYWAPYSTQFASTDGYTIGALAGQNGWRDSDSGASIVVTNATTGAQAISVAGTSIVSRNFYTLKPSVTVDNTLYLSSSVNFSPTGATLPQGVAALVSYDPAQGVMAFNGDGNEGGTWVVAPNTLLNDQWAKVSLVEDYATKTWSLKVNDQTVLTGLGFKSGTLSRFVSLQVANGLLDQTLFNNVSISAQ